MTTPAGPYPFHTRLTFSGYFGPEANPYEQWSFRLNGDLGGDGDPIEADLINVRTAYNTHLRPVLRTYCVLKEIKYAAINDYGKYRRDPVILDMGAGGLPGESVEGAPLPPQCAVVVSLNSATRGASGRGRIYLPGVGLSIDAADGLMSAARAQTLAGAAGGFLSALKTTGVIGNPSIVSYKGLRSPITSVRVGRAVDTVRSRRRSLQEGYTANVGIA